MALNMAAVGASVLTFQALYWLAHVVSKIFVVPYGAMAAYDRNQFCQFVCSFVKVMEYRSIFFVKIMDY